MRVEQRPRRVGVKRPEAERDEEDADRFEPRLLLSGRKEQAEEERRSAGHAHVHPPLVPPIRRDGGWAVGVGLLSRGEERQKRAHVEALDRVDRARRATERREEREELRRGEPEGRDTAEEE